MSREEHSFSNLYTNSLPDKQSDLMNIYESLPAHKKKEKKKGNNKTKQTKSKDVKSGPSMRGVIPSQKKTEKYSCLDKKGLNQISVQFLSISFKFFFCDGKEKKRKKKKRKN